MWSADRGSILEVQQNGNNWYASTVAGGLGQTTSPRWSNTYHPNITQVTGPTATRTADRGSILETEQDCKKWGEMLALDQRQTTASPDRNRYHTAMDTPVDRTIGRAGRLTTAAAEADIEGTTKRERADGQQQKTVC
jgi:hypothetical protein